MKQWDDLAQAVANDRGAAQRFWSDYYQKEKAVYEIDKRLKEYSDDKKIIL